MVSGFRSTPAEHEILWSAQPAAAAVGTHFGRVT